MDDDELKDKEKELMQKHIFDKQDAWSKRKSLMGLLKSHHGEDKDDE